MYYKEQLINGIWHYKLSPNAEWKPFSIEQLNDKITNLKNESKSLTDKLSIEEQNHFIKTLFGLEMINVSTELDSDPHYVVYDEEGNEFYGSDYNCQFDFSTLAGIFSYTAHNAKNQGYSDCQYAMRKLLGLS